MIKFFEAVKIANRHGIMAGGQLDNFDPDEFQHLDAPEVLPSGSMESWTSVFYPVVQGTCER